MDFVSSKKRHRTRIAELIQDFCSEMKRQAFYSGDSYKNSFRVRGLTPSPYLHRLWKEIQPGETLTVTTLTLEKFGKRSREVMGKDLEIVTNDQIIRGAIQQIDFVTGDAGDRIEVILMSISYLEGGVWKYAGNNPDDCLHELELSDRHVINEWGNGERIGIDRTDQPLSPTWIFMMREPNIRPKKEF